jgi:hypothetical protein
MFRKLAFFVLVLPFISACSTFHPLKDGVGFSEIPVGQDAYQVTFVGNSSMSVAETRQNCLLRASELAALRSVPYFQITSERVFLSYGSHDWPGTDTAYVETIPDRRGRTRAIIHRVYSPDYTEVYMIPEVTMQIRITADAANAIPAAYLLRQAQQNKTKLSPGVAERIANLPVPDSPVELPPPPAPTTKPAP